MPIYEHYREGQRIDRVLPEPGKYDDTRIGLLRLQRIDSGERDGWYVDGEWAQAEAERQQSESDPQVEPEKPPRRSRATTPEEG